MKHNKTVLVVLLVLTLASLCSAQLERVGPVNSFGYPSWYQDKSGLTLDFCTPLNQAELDGGYCLLLTGDTTAPEVFPTSFFDEHFYWAADALIPFNLPGGGASKARLVMAVEGAFAVGPVIQGDQITFGRLRVNIPSLPYSGTYVIRHPYGTWTFDNQVAGSRLFFTEDIGIQCLPGQFDCALATSIGPFLLASNTPGGAELPAVPGPVAGKLYIADPARIGPVTGSPIGQNFFRVEGPNGFVISTSDFTLMGRVVSEALPGRVTVTRASYNNPGTGISLDVFANAVPSTQGRLPAAPKPAAVTPILALLAAPCGASATGAAIAPPTGTPEAQMFGNGSVYYGQYAVQGSTIPTGVCVEDYTARDANGQVVPTFFNGSVSDVVTITEAIYNPGGGGSLSVKAASSDAIKAPTLSVLGFGNTAKTDLAGGSVAINPVAAVPSAIQVKSSLGGVASILVSTVANTSSPSPSIPVAGNDEYTIAEDSGTANFAVLANDTVGGFVISSGATVAITAAPRLGTATVNADGTIGYTPTLNNNGTEGIGYTVTVNGVVSNVAYITIFITPVDDAPTAVADSTTGVVSKANSLDVLANDIDPDGATDLAAAVIVTWPSQLGVKPTPTTGVITFMPTATGSYSFTYRAKDAAGVLSANTVSVSVLVSAAETITVTRADFVITKKRWRVDGTDSVTAGQTLTITYANGTRSNGTSLVGTLIGTAVVDVAGAWTWDSPNATGILDLTNTAQFGTAPTQIRVTSTSPVLGGTSTRAILRK